MSLLPKDDPDALLRTIGNTPLIPLLRVGAEKHIYIKAEWFNPGGSVKDRPAYRMIRAGEVSGQMTPDKIILDATSGNTGIAYAMIGARRGYRIKLMMPANASAERKKLLAAYGAELVLTDPAQGSDGAYFETQKLYKERPDLYFYPDQYGNPENPRAHYETTAAEIIEQTNGLVTHFIAGLGTSGTMIGTGQRLREFNANIEIIAMQPSGPFHGLEGMKHMETASHVPEIYDPKFADEVIGVDTEAAQAMALRLTREEGLYVGVSAGAAVCAALKLDGKCVVAVAPDGGARYQSDKFWEAK
jgi:S-sulfo-L-cysteine synthase (O-acetyl-L-serine-dependent)